MKTPFILIFCLNSIFSYSQTITLEFNDTSLKEVLLKIENEIDYKFYFVEEWLLNNRVSGKFENLETATVLEAIFNQTELNFFIDSESKIILTRNNIIYNELPDYFFGYIIDSISNKENKKSISVDDQGNYNPIFFKNYSSSNTIKVETIRIGKESKTNTKNQYHLQGTIKALNSSSSLSNIAVKVKGKNKGTITNSNGKFDIDLRSGLNVLIISSLGYERVEKNVIIYSDGVLDINLVEQIESLDEVVLKSNVEKNIDDVNTGTTTVDLKIIKNIPLVLGERDIFKVAASLPGISSAGEGASGYNVRGGKTDQNLYLLDDGVIYNPTHFFGLFSAINPFTTGSFDVYKGNIPAEFGGRLSSVFDIKTKDSNTEKFSGEVAIGPVTSNIALEIPIVKDKTAVLIGGRSTYSDWILNVLDDEQLQNSSAFFYDAIVKFNTKIGEKDDLKTTIYYSKDRFSITSDSTYNYSNRLLTGRWNHHFNDKSTSSVIVTNSVYKFNIDYDGVSNNDFDFGYQNSETELKIKGLYKLNPKHKINYGISSKLYGISPGELKPKGSESIVIPKTISDEQGLESAVFISDIFKINKKLIINAGLRYSLYLGLGESNQLVYEDGLPKNEATVIDTIQYKKNEVIKNYGGPEFRFSARYLLGNEYSVKASVNNTNQYIHSLSNNTTVSPVDTWTLSDANIKPQKAIQYSLGFYKNLNDNMYQFSIEGYYKSTKNVLDYKVGADFILNENIETEVLQGKGKAYGVEFLIRKNIGRFNGWLGYTYSRSFNQFKSDFAEEQINNGEYFPSNYDKPHDLSVVTNYKITQRYSVSANFAYQTGRAVTVPVGNYILNGSEYVLYSNRNEYRIPDYYRLDLSVNIEGSHKIEKRVHTFWNFSIYNLLGRNNPYSVFFINENGEIKAYQSSIFSVPIPTVTFNLKF